MKTTKKLLAIFAIGALGVSLTACGSSDDGDKSPEADTKAAQQSEEPAKDDESGGEEKPSGEVKNKDTIGDGLQFGDTYEYEDGLKVTIGAVEDFTPSDNIANQLTDYPIRYKAKATIENGSDKKLDLGMYAITVKSGSDAGQLFGDPEQNLEAMPYGEFAPGDSKSTEVGLALPSDGELSLEFQIVGENEREKITFKK
ncbi:MAG: hypothetical protein Q4P66_02925 [Actinomycetaceae bacterium]|nr:hypothetical protein [Actinomycetaceae bacterium]